MSFLLEVNGYQILSVSSTLLNSVGIFVVTNPVNIFLSILGRYSRISGVFFLVLYYTENSV